jgi:hypothetical protein
MVAAARELPTSGYALEVDGRLKTEFTTRDAANLARIAFVPKPVEVLRRPAKLDDEVARQVLRLDFASLFVPEPEEGGLVISHDGSGVRTAYEGSPIPGIGYLRVCCDH